MIKIDDFKKLKQLDRIEYILRLNRIEKKNPFNVMWSIIIAFSFVLGFLFLVFLGMSNLVGIEKAVPILISMNNIIKIMMIPLLLLGLLIDMIFLLRKKIWEKDLEKEFFKAEVKPIK